MQKTTLWNRRFEKFITLFALLIIPYITHAAITKGPYLVHPTQTSMTVLWECDTTETATVQWGTPSQLNNETKVHPFDSKNGFYLYKVEITNLQPDTKYQYRVVMPNGENVVSYFKTSPQPNSPISFAAIGDSRTGHDIFKKITMFLDQYSPGIIISMGDLVGLGKNFDEWGQHYFGPAAQLINHIPLISTLGDHDDRGDSAENFFYFFRPSKDKEHVWFSFDYGPAHFVSLDYRYEHDPEMADWFEKDMQASKAKWKFVYLHRPTYNLGGHRMNWGRGVWPELYRKHKVDIVFTGHSHMYERFYPMRPSDQPDAWPVTYITTGGAGAGLYESIPNTHLAKTESVNHILLVHINSDTLHLKAIRLDKSIMDEFRIIKQGGHYDQPYLSFVKPQEDMDVYMLFASRLLLRFSKIPTATDPATAGLSFPVSGIDEEIPFKFRLTKESAKHYRIDPIEGVVKPGERFSATVNLYAKHPVKNNGRYFDPPVVFEVEYHTSFTSGVAVGRQSRYYPPKK